MPSYRGRGGFIVTGLGFGLAAGIACGTFLIAPHINTDGGLLRGGSDASSDVQPSSEDDAAQSSEVTAARAEAAVAEALVQDNASKMVDGALTDRPVLIFRAPSVDDSIVGDLRGLADEAGAINAGQITLTEKFFDRAAADELASIVTATMPAGTQLDPERSGPVQQAGQVLASALLLSAENGQPLASPQDRALVLQTLREAGFINYDDGTILPAQVVAVLAGADKETVGAFADLAVAMDKAGGATAVVADTPAILDDERRSALADDGVSTVDQASTAAGRVALILALSEQTVGEVGRYGAGEGLDAVVPRR